MNRETAYIRMALGLPLDYSEEQMEFECESDVYATVDYVWTDQPVVDEICKAWGISRARFIRSMAAPKPGYIAHLVFNDELIKRGLEPLPQQPKGQGLLIPERDGKKIIGINFRTMKEILKNESA